MKFHESGLAFPDADEFMMAHLSKDSEHARFTYQLDHLDAAMKYVKQCRSALDGGAHAGVWSRAMSALFERVIAVEPSPDTFECLTHNTAAMANVERLHAGLGAAPGQIHMALAPEQEARKNTGGRYAVPGGDIPVVTIDSLELVDLDFLKLDVEGSEFYALQGAADTLKRCKPIVLFENKFLWVRHFGLPKNAVADFLTRANYRLLEVTGCDHIYGPIA